MGIDPIQAIEGYKFLGFTWIRLGCYWNEIERDRGIFSFTVLDQLVRFCEKENIHVLMCVGMKAPRWPEYYIPDWLLKRIDMTNRKRVELTDKDLLGSTLQFLTHCIRHYKKSSAIKIWQVENEPLDPSGEKFWNISSSFLNQEIQRIKEIDPNRKILITVWGNELGKRGVYKEAEILADIIGLDIYPRVPTSILRLFTFYTGPSDSRSKIRKITEQILIQGKEFWITELQAEPWEIGSGRQIRINPPSFHNDDLYRNFEYAKSLSPTAILFWGFEYWYSKKITGDTVLWNSVASLVTAAKK